MEEMFNLVTWCSFNQKMKKISNFAVESYLKSIKYCLSFSVLHSFTVQHSNPFSLRGKLQSPSEAAYATCANLFLYEAAKCSCEETVMLKKTDSGWAELVYNSLGFAGFKIQAGNINHRRTFLQRTTPICWAASHGNFSLSVILLNQRLEPTQKRDELRHAKDESVILTLPSGVGNKCTRLAKCSKLLVLAWTQTGQTTHMPNGEGEVQSYYTHKTGQMITFCS